MDCYVAGLARSIKPRRGYMQVHGCGAARPCVMCGQFFISCRASSRCAHDSSGGSASAGYSALSPFQGRVAHYTITARPVTQMAGTS